MVLKKSMLGHFLEIDKKIFYYNKMPKRQKMIRLKNDENRKDKIIFF